jgi:hypothetical protein
MSKAAGGGSSEGQSKMVLRQEGIFQVTLLAQMKAATEFRGGNFFVRANDLFRLCKGMMDGIIWTDFTFFPGLPLASSRFFRYLDSKLFFGFGWRFFYSGLSDTGSQGFRWI